MIYNILYTRKLYTYSILDIIVISIIRIFNEFTKYQSSDIKLVPTKIRI